VVSTSPKARARQGNAAGGGGWRFNGIGCGDERAAVNDARNPDLFSGEGLKKGSLRLRGGPEEVLDLLKKQFGEEANRPGNPSRMGHSPLKTARRPPARQSALRRTGRT